MRAAVAAVCLILGFVVCCLADPEANQVDAAADEEVKPILKS